MSYRTYTYDFYNDIVASPHAYVPERSFSGIDIGVGHFDEAIAFSVDDNDNIYIVDRQNNRIIHIDEEYELKRIIDEFYHEKNQQTEGFDHPNDISVEPEGDMYIADSGNNRIIHLNKDGDFVREIVVTGEHDMIDDDYYFSPLKLDVDQSGRIYVINEGEFEGLLFLQQDAEFAGFIGAPSVDPNPFEYFWQNLIATEEQRR
ncbi:MAG: hypothetical protein ACOC2W_04525, partial [bacterium]